MYCTRCGNKTGERDRFCAACGNVAPGSAPAFLAGVPSDAAPLTRSLRNRKIAGVCGGIGRHFGVDPTIVRIIFLAMLFCPLPAIIPYIVCWIVVPLERPDPVYPVAVGSYPLANQPYPAAPMAR